MKDEIIKLIIVAIFLAGVIGALIDGWIAPVFAILSLLIIGGMEGVFSVNKSKRIEKEFFTISQEVHSK